MLGAFAALRQIHDGMALLNEGHAANRVAIRALFAGLSALMPWRRWHSLSEEQGIKLNKAASELGYAPPPQEPRPVDPAGGAA